MRRKEPMPRESKGERHPLNNLSELRAEVRELYWGSRHRTGRKARLTARIGNAGPVTVGWRRPASA
jgi:hypothetical protein